MIFSKNAVSNVEHKILQGCLFLTFIFVFINISEQWVENHNQAISRIEEKKYIEANGEKVHQNGECGFGSRTFTILDILLFLLFPLLSYLFLAKMSIYRLSLSILCLLLTCISPLTGLFAHYDFVSLLRGFGGFTTYGYGSFLGSGLLIIALIIWQILLLFRITRFKPPLP